MTKILYVPTGTILTFLVKYITNNKSSVKRTTNYEESVYVTEAYKNKRPLLTAKKFIWSLCNTERHVFFKAYSKLPDNCVIEEFELIND